MQKPDYFYISRDILEPLVANILNNLYKNKILPGKEFKLTLGDSDMHDKRDIVGYIEDDKGMRMLAFQVKTITKITNKYWIKHKSELVNNDGFIFFEKPINKNWDNNAALAKHELIGTKLYMVTSKYLDSLFNQNLFHLRCDQFLIADNRYITEHSNKNDVYVYTIKEDDFNK